MNACAIFISLEFAVLKTYPASFAADHSIVALAVIYCPSNPAVSLLTCLYFPVPIQRISMLAVAPSGTGSVRKGAFTMVKQFERKTSRRLSFRYPGQPVFFPGEVHHCHPCFSVKLNEALA